MESIQGTSNSPTLGRMLRYLDAKCQHILNRHLGLHDPNKSLRRRWLQYIPQCGLGLDRLYQLQWQYTAHYVYMGVRVE
jgi:cell division inhibitor SulA